MRHLELRRRLAGRCGVAQLVRAEANVGVMEILAGKSIEGLAGDVVGRSKLVAIVEKKEW